MTYFILFIVYDDCYVGCDICICTFIAYFVRNDEIKMFNQYVGLYAFSLPISVVMIEIIYIYIYFVLSSSSNRKYELLPIV